MSWKGKAKKRPGSSRMRNTIRAAGGTLNGRPAVLVVIGTEQAMLNADDWQAVRDGIDGLFRVALLKGGTV